MTECIQQMNEELRNYHVSLAAVVRCRLQMIRDNLRKVFFSN